MSVNPQTQTEGQNQLEEVIKGFLSKYEFLHEYRLQKLIYIVDLLAVEEEGERLTSVDFKPFMYGSYAEDIGDLLEKLKDENDVRAKPDMRHGKVTSAYVDDGLDEDEIPEEVRELVDRVYKATKGKSNEDLAKWSKETWLYDNIQYGEEMDFDEYKRMIDTGRIKSDLRDEFSDLFD